MIGTVYHIFNTLDGKSYVGQTWDTLDSRWKQHCGAHGEMIVMRAIRKHGPSSFVRTLLTTCENQENLDAAEDAFIIELGTLFPAGYNLKRGGSHGRHTEESRRKMSESHRGKKPPASSAFGKDFPRWNKGKKGCFSEETIKKMRLAKLGKKIHSEDSKRRIGEATRARRSKAVICLNDGRQFSSTVEAGKYYSIGEQMVARVARGDRNHTNGLRFKYQKVQGDQ